jgi:glycine betaine catabolism B
MFSMMKLIDAALNRITMYQLALYSLIFLLAAAVALSFAGVLAYNPFAILFSTAFLLVVCGLTNWIFARGFDVPTNEESAYITALILALIITPIQSYADLWFLFWAGVLAMASKYILAIRGKHVFNPAAIAVAITYYATNQSASWWIGSPAMTLFVLAAGLLVVRRIRRFDLVLSFLAAALAATAAAALFGGNNPVIASARTLLYSPLLFFAFIMLTEPLTMPPTRRLRMLYGALVGFLFTPLFHIGSFYTTPETALLFGNVFAYLVSPKAKLILKLKAKTQLAQDAYEFSFAPARKLAFAPGQYMEWTLPMSAPDSRGNRRYFTLASSPTERDLRVGVKFASRGSAFKSELLAMEPGSEIAASQLAGDFVLPEDRSKKLVFLAGGIGITPFRSMLQYLLDRRERRNITLFYTNRRADEIVYQDVLSRAASVLGVQVVYILTDPNDVPYRWPGLVGRIQPEWIRRYVPDYRQRIFYLSGPVGMVDAVKTMLHGLGIPDTQIRTDYFSGLA